MQKGSRYPFSSANPLLSFPAHLLPVQCPLPDPGIGFWEVCVRRYVCSACQGSVVTRETKTQTCPRVTETQLPDNLKQWIIPNNV